MAKLSDDEQKSLDDLLAKRDAPDEPEGPSHSRVENVNITINLDDEVQVKRAIRSGLLPASYLEDDGGDGGDDGGGGDGGDDGGKGGDGGGSDPAPRRRLDARY